MCQNQEAPAGSIHIDPPRRADEGGEAFREQNPVQFPAERMPRPRSQIHLRNPEALSTPVEMWFLLTFGEPGPALYRQGGLG
jgi:hypothetical protein